MKSGRHIASIWEALGSVVAPLGAVGCPFADWKSLEASVGPAEGGEASPPSFAEVL